MRMRNLLIVGLLLAGIVATAVVEGYVNPKISAEAERYRLAQQDPLTHDFGSVLEYRSPYMGDAGNLTKLNNHLPLATITSGYELHPEELRADIIYKESADAYGEEALKRAVLYTAAANFVLIDNLRKIQLSFDGSVYSVTREDVEAWCGAPLSSLQDEASWQRYVQGRIADEEAVNDFFE